MKRKAVSGIMLTLISISMLTLAFNIQLVKAGSTTIIVPDDYAKIQWAINAANPGDTVYVRAGIYYERPYVSKDNLTIVGENKQNTIIDGSNYGAVLQVYAENVAVRGFTVRNGGWGYYYYQGSGIYLGEYTLPAKSCNISDNIVSDCRFGIPQWNSNYNTIKGNTISYTEQGISFSGGRDNIVVGNVISNGVFGSYPPLGIQVWDSNNNTINGNTISDPNQGIIVGFSEDNTISGNNIANNDWDGIRLFESSNNTISGNNITASNMHGIGLDWSSDNTISENNITNSRDGIHLYESSNNAISGNNIMNNEDGISLDWSSNYNTISGNNITANSEFGIRLDWFSNYNTISGNNITNNNWEGIWLRESSNNTISGNNITNNNWDGIGLDWSSNNAISGNNIANNGYGIWLYESSNNTISGNNIANNDYGILLYWFSNYNTIYHNNFLDNTFIQAYCYESTNVWDDGYLSGGNYWSNYAGVDADGDGIGDTPHDIDANNQDRYPLMEPWSIPTMIKSLIRTVVFWNLHKGTENSLTSKLDDAVHLFDKGNENGAIHKLMDFINQVEALRGKKLNDEQADQLISEAQKIIDLING